jgi:hypothetical protein
MSTTEILMVIAGAVESLATLGGLIVMIVALKRVSDVNVTNRELRVHVEQKLHDLFASKPEFQEHVRDNDRQRGILHKRLDDAIQDYNEKFQALPNEIVALLRNTGNLK